MSYLKIDQNRIIQAPHKIERNGYIIYGYDKENNEAMLFEDGYAKFPKAIDSYEIKDGQIVEKIDPEPIPIEKTVFTKLQIRRAMRKLLIEDQLDKILEENESFRKDWNDAQEINLSDGMIQSAIQSGLISQSIIDQIKRSL